MFILKAAQETPIRVPSLARERRQNVKRQRSFPYGAKPYLLKNLNFRALLIVLDSAGAGQMPKHPRRDTGCNTIPNVAERYRQETGQEIRLPNLGALGLGNLANIPGVPPAANPAAAYRLLSLDPIPLTETTTSLWALGGVETGELVTYPSGIPAEIMGQIEDAIKQILPTPVTFIKDGRNISGTAIIEEQGLQSQRQYGNRPIVYTSSDSVFQVAFFVGREVSSREERLPDGHSIIEEIEAGTSKFFLVSDEAVAKMQDICRTIRKVMDESGDPALKFLRVIARPFVERLTPGPQGEKYIRSATLRQDLTATVPGQTILDAATKKGFHTVGIGKFAEVFGFKGFGSILPDPFRHTTDIDAIDLVVQALSGRGAGIVGADLVELDERYGHRNDPLGYAEQLMRIDAALPRIFSAMEPTDICLITADHGNDPTRGLASGDEYRIRGTNHTREFVPLLVFGNMIRGGVDLGYGRLSDVAASIAYFLGMRYQTNGTNFLNRILDRSVFKFADEGAD
ncbi:hypothetical protein A3H38_01175 [candidate division WOR-1 bacterium RIFCSPLOWO2_02_FULL_46_20]|nr:MAG: hypothetical protein A3H38_01175 [candidate division WOR-1 bacterium RIFCSPLOWO2_02_FULL_46_20]